MWRWVLSAALVGSCWPGAATADVYSYKQDNGTFAFTDDPKQVPERYRSEAKQSPDQPLKDYPRLTVRATPAAPPAKPPSAEAPSQARSVVADEPAASPEAAPRDAYLQAGHGLLVPIESDAEAEPIRVEQHVRWINGRYARVTVVRRGDQVLMEIEHDQQGALHY